ncbi:hypothetical protein C4D60_Mb05t01530 [Musa balbisiana]|uniref:Heparanase-like protein 1 n=1 Tax=Musa balbisiana TaxID=52838 RepID=A0A4S8JSY6_MUSBA|nr:hypothetical protein C4D60_Mb05t01530 [Musa balbisiana]
MILQLVLLVLCSIGGALSEESPDVTIIVKGSDLAAETDDTFVCATLDWWPHDKCNYNQCPWGQSSVLNLDLSHPFLAKAIQAFDHLRIRVGGSLQDQVVYGAPSLEAIITFGLNALRGRHRVHNGMWAGDWNSTNTRDFIEYTISKGYQVDSWEFGKPFPILFFRQEKSNRLKLKGGLLDASGNELSGRGIGARVSAEQYAKDLVVLRALLKELYEDSNTQPMLVAPGGFFDQQWYAQLLQDSGLGVVNVMTHHIYNLGGGDDSHIESKIMDPQYLSRVADTFRNLQLTIERHGPWSSAWVGEAGGAFNSGSRLFHATSQTKDLYLDQLGMASKYNTKVYCRQTLIGGNYGLLDTNTFIPNPDYYRQDIQNT